MFVRRFIGQEFGLGVPWAFQHLVLSSGELRPHFTATGGGEDGAQLDGARLGSDAAGSLGAFEAPSTQPRPGH